MNVIGNGFPVVYVVFAVIERMPQTDTGFEAKGNVAACVLNAELSNEYTLKVMVCKLPNPS